MNCFGRHTDNSEKGHPDSKGSGRETEKRSENSWSVAVWEHLGSGQMALQTPVALESFPALQQDTIICFHNGSSTSRNVYNMTVSRG